MFKSGDVLTVTVRVAELIDVWKFLPDCTVHASVQQKQSALQWLEGEQPSLFSQLVDGDRVHVKSFRSPVDLVVQLGERVFDLQIVNRWYMPLEEDWPCSIPRLAIERAEKKEVATMGSEIRAKEEASMMVSELRATEEVATTGDLMMVSASSVSEEIEEMEAPSMGLEFRATEEVVEKTEASTMGSSSLTLMLELHAR